MSHHDSTARALLPRGVHRAPYLLNGSPVLHAIDRHGNCVRRVRLAGRDERVVHAWLSGYIEHVDPAPQLRLIKPTLPAASMDHGTFARLISVRR